MASRRLVPTIEQGEKSAEVLPEQEFCYHLPELLNNRWDPTAGGRDGMTSPKEPAATRAQLASRDGIATCEAERQSVEDHADNRRSTLEA